MPRTQTSQRARRITDLLVVLGLFLLAVISRGYRLEEPRAMYFDEVYHARTAMEFLQDWRYGEVHDIYEWTHPHLAKYLMALGIVVLGDDQVVGTGSVAVPVTTAVYERPWMSDAGQRGDLLWVGGPHGVTAIHPGADASTSVATSVTAPVSAIALDQGGHRLYAATPAGVVVVDTTDPAADAPRLLTQSGITAIVPTGDDLVTLSDDGTVASWTTAGDPLERTTVDGAVSLAPGASPYAGTPLVAAGTDAGDVAFLDAGTLAEVDRITLDHPATTMVLDTDLDPVTLFVGGGTSVSAIGLADDGRSVTGPLALPGPVTALAWDQAAELVHAVTRTSTGTPTVAVIDPQGLTLFADAAVPFPPAAIAVVDQPEVPSQPVRVVAFSADGVSATIDAGSNAFAWRAPGVLAGALTVVLLYLLGRLIARRRTVAIAAAGLALLDGMMFVTARVGMNDVYVTLCIVAATTLFATIWLGRWRRPWVVGTALVGVGLLLGLALASKWVGLYALGGIGLLVLARSALGRVLVLLGLLGATSVLGAMAITAADVPDPNRDWTFLVLMLGITALVGAAIVRRPLRFEPGELRNGGAIGVALGIIAMLLGMVAGTLTIIGAGAALLLGGIVALALERRPGIRARTAIHADVPTFLRPGQRHGIPWLLTLGCLTAIPVVVYVISYLPWVALGNQLWQGFPAGHTGQTLWELTQSMYAYHNDLRQAHPASSPWWAWMLDLKPVWMYLGDMAGGLTANIYDGANPLILWSSIAGLVFTGLTAWRKRHLGAGLVIVMFLSLWLPWARIDRATFQYHLTSSLPFALLALGLLLSALWHRSSDGRAVVIVFGVLAGVVSLLLYPTVAALPVGGTLSSWVTTLLPTWAYDYQFGVNLDPAVHVPLINLTALTVAVIGVGLTGGAMWLAGRWHGGPPGWRGGPHDPDAADVPGA